METTAWKYTWKRDKKIYLVFAACFLACLSIDCLIGYIDEHYYHGMVANPIEKESIKIRFFVGCVMAPLLETFLFQYLPFGIFKALKIKNIFILIVLPALLFGLSHWYSPMYVVATFITGLIFNFLYIYCKKNQLKAFWIVALLHFLCNFLAFFSNL
jgi:hypothetical protein